ncbi:hypothetical protein DMJ13_22900 [halophilic archaeon]|nr:hypothetical protein DMJ13_22900 [halophilic archaeon]
MEEQTLSKKNSMSDRDIRQAQRRIEQKYGQLAAYNTFPEFSEKNIGTEDVQAANQNVTRERSWEMHYNVYSDQTGVKLADTDHFLNLYKANNTDANGNVVYFFESLNYSDDVDSWYNSSTRYMDNYVNLTTSKDDLHRIRPNQTVYVGGGGSTHFELSVGPATVGTTFSSNGGQLSPDGNRLSFGPNGEFAAELTGNIQGTASMSTLMDVRSTTGYWSRNWKTNVRASTTA